MNKKISLTIMGVCSLVLSTQTNAALLTFDGVITGSTSFAFDGDGDNVDDVIFTTTDPAGFNIIGPGPNMTNISEPGLEGSTLTDPDLRVDFLVGAAGSLSFGFALDDFAETVNTWASFEVYDINNNLLGSDFETGLYTFPDGLNQSDFPEGIIKVNFSGLASYALFDFNNDATGGQRYIIDNFEGTFGTSENPPGSVIPVPAAVWLFASGLLGLVGVARKKST